MPTEWDLNSGDILIWGTAPGALKSKLDYLKLVRLLTVSNFGHVSTVLRQGNEIFHIEAVQPKIRMTKIIPTEELYFIPMGVGHKQLEIENFFRDKIGLPYGLMDAIRAWLGFTLKDENKWQCAELCLELYRHLGLEIPNAFTPNDLVKTIMRTQKKPLIKLNAIEGA